MWLIGLVPLEKILIFNDKIIMDHNSLFSDKLGPLQAPASQKVLKSATRAESEMKTAVLGPHIEDTEKSCR